MSPAGPAKRAAALAAVLPAIALLTGALSTVALLSGCQDIFNALLETGAPVGVDASDGEYADRIEVHWGAPSLTGEKWEGKSLTGYTLSWSGPDSGEVVLPPDRSSYSISVSAADRAAMYDITVESEIDHMNEGSAADTGFALETFDLLWYDGGSDYSFTGADRWYVTMLQEGFDYTFAFENGKIGRVEFYAYKTLDKLADTGADGPAPAWTCDEDGNGHKFYARVVPSTPGASFRASYGF